MQAWERERALFGWLFASLLLHLLLLAFVRVGGLPNREPASEPIEVDLASLPPPAAAPATGPEAASPPQPAQPRLALPERQIVNPPDAGEERTPPEQTRLLSDRDNRVPEESVKRASEFAPRQAPRPQAAPREDELPQPRKAARGAAREVTAERSAEAEGREQIASLPKLEQLLPQVGDLPVTAGKEEQASGGGAAAEKASRRFLRGGGPVFQVHPGTTDFLPGIREGDITLLNTKAERFAPFVRRVAGRIFQHLDIRLRQAARSGIGSPGHEFAVVEAVMDRHGRFVSARVTRRESTSTFGADRILLSATSPDTFFDANPPPGAEAEDGNIHFVLLIDLQIVAAPDPRSGRMAIGYQGIAGVGLDALPEQRAN